MGDAQSENVGGACAIKGRCAGHQRRARGREVVDHQNAPTSDPRGDRLEGIGHVAASLRWIQSDLRTSLSNSSQCPRIVGDREELRYLFRNQSDLIITSTLLSARPQRHGGHKIGAPPFGEDKSSQALGKNPGQPVIRAVLEVNQGAYEGRAIGRPGTHFYPRPAR